MEFFSNILNTLPPFLADALVDSIKLIPFLFVIFVFIEIFENYFSHKINSFLKYSNKFGPIIGALVATIPQCGFSVIAATLYIKKFISAGTLIAVFIATSDEAIPILLSEPNQFPTILKIIIVKIVLGISVGYVVDYYLRKHQFSRYEYSNEELVVTEKGCCDHEIEAKKLSLMILHPIKHTLHIFFFILCICTALNFLLENFTISNSLLSNNIVQPIVISCVGLIPNCAISVLITMLYLKNIIGFGSVIAGLSAGGGLGILVLLRNNKNWRDSIFILEIVLFISIAIGILLQCFKIS